MPASASAPSFYPPRFYGDAAGAFLSANLVVPLVLGYARITSVVDVGCGTGSWLAAFRANGIEDVLGFDGDWVQATQLKIPADRLVCQDLTRPLRVNRRFDLAICLEVAEHLPETRAASFVEDLTRLAPCVLFSAAIPDQGGTGHINEQFLSYWAGHFEREGFGPVDLVRPAIWSNDKIEWWYRQNIMIFGAADQPILNADSRLRSANDYIHPRYLQQLRQKQAVAPVTLGQLAREFPGALKRSLRSRSRRLIGR